MAESSEQGRSFDPILTDPLAVSFPDDLAREYRERKRTSRSSLALLRDPTFNSYIPYAWGFTIYRVRFEGDSDARFAQALQRLTQWTQWLVRTTRYTEEGSPDSYPEGVTAPVPPTTDDPTDHLANRLYNEVIEVYPNADAVVAGPEGEEDFSPVGQAFAEWVAGLNVDLTLSKNNARYDHCLIIDKNALESLELLPETLPPIEYRKMHHPKHNEVFDSYHRSWVWVLDRKTCEAFLQGQKIEYPPWIRLRLNFFLSIWFERVKGAVPVDWQLVVEEDKRKWETVRWWSPAAGYVNRLNRDMRAAGGPSILEMADQLRQAMSG